MDDDDRFCDMCGTPLSSGFCDRCGGDGGIDGERCEECYGTGEQWFCSNPMCESNLP